MNTFDKVFRNSIEFLTGFTFGQLENSVENVTHNIRVEYVEPIKTYSASCILDSNVLTTVEIKDTYNVDVVISNNDKQVLNI